MTRPIVLKVSPILYGRMEVRATQQRQDVPEWVLRAVIGELLRLENEEARCAQAVLAARSSPPIVQPATERTPHAPHC